MATDTTKEVHDIHPSLANLTGTIGLAKKRLSHAATDQEYKVKRVATADNLKSGALRPFANSGERNFLILIENIELYNDKELTDLTTHITLEKDAIVSGTYLYNDNNVVSIGNPYNVYCKALNVEPQDLLHTEYIENQNEFEQNNDPPNDYVVIANNPSTEELETENGNTSVEKHVSVSVPEPEPEPATSKPYDPQKMNTMRVISMDENDTEDITDLDPDITDTVLIPVPVKDHGPHIMQPSTSHIPEIDNDLNQNYPTTSIENIQSKNESFIGRLPSKQKAVINTENGIQFEQINENTNTNNNKLQSDDMTSSRTNLTDYHKQAMDNRNNMNYNVSTNDNNNNNANNKQSMPAKYFFNNFLIRALILSISLLIVSILSFGEWFRNQSIQSFKSAYGLSAFGIFVIFLGSFGCIFGGILEIVKIHMPNKRYFIWFIAVLYIIGGVFYFFGACAVVNSYNSISTIFEPYSGIWWTEMFYVSVISILFGIDMFKHFLDRWDLRVTIFLTLYVFCGFILSICCLMWAQYDDIFITLGVAYLLSTICGLIFLLLRLLVVLTTKIKTSSIIELGLMIFILIFIIIIAFTYFVISGQNEINRASYYIGIGIFHILMGVFITFDITFCQYLIPILC